MKLPTSVIFTVTGTNDTPVVAGVVDGSTVSENGAAFALNLLANASDIDTADVLHVKLGKGDVVTASVTEGTWSSPITFAAGDQLTLDPAQFNALGGGETLGITFGYQLTDGTKANGDAAASAHVTISGENDAPVTLSLSSTHVVEQSAAGAVVGQFATLDPDRNEAFTYTILNDQHGYFAIEGNSLVVAAGANLDSNAFTSDVVGVQVSDSGGATLVNNFVIAIDSIPGVTISGSGKDDTYNLTSPVHTTNGNDVVNGNNGNDTIDGGAGNDILNGDSGNDTIFGGAGNDTINGGVGTDSIDGGGGNDTIIISGNDSQLDTINAGAGNDTALVQGNSSVTLNNFNAGASSIENWAGNGSSVSGTGGIDIIDLSYLKSMTGLSFVDANSGDDTVIGSNYADVLRGGAGNDSITGGKGNDTLSGGAGADTFVYRAGDIGPANADHITDFSLKDGDKLDIRDLLSGYNPATSHVSEFVSLVMVGGGTQVQVDSDGAGGAQSFQTLVTLDGLTSGLLLSDLQHPNFIMG